MTTPTDTQRQAALYSTVLTQGHNFSPDRYRPEETPKRAFDLETIRNHFINAQTSWNWFHNYYDDPNAMPPREAHFWLMATTHPDMGDIGRTYGSKQAIPSEAVASTITEEMLAEHLTIEQAQPYFDWLADHIGHQYYNNLEVKAYSLLAQLVDHEPLFEHLIQNNVSFGHLVVLCAFFDSSVSPRICDIIREHIKTMSNATPFNEWQNVLIAMEYHGDTALIEHYFTQQASGLDTMREALLTRQLPKEDFFRLVYEQRRVPFCSALLKHHLCTFGFEGFEHILERLEEGHTDLRSSLFNIHHKDITKLVLKAATDEDSSYRVNAYRWLKDEGANAIIGLIEHIESDNPTHQDLARTILTHYLRVGLPNLVMTLSTDAKPETRQWLDEQHQQLNHQDDVTIPEWFAYWSKRGVRMNKNGHHIHIALPPLRTVEGQWLTDKLRDSLLRLFQDQHKARAQQTLPHLSGWLDEPSRIALIDYFNTLWSQFEYRRDLQWSFVIQPHLHVEYMLPHVSTILHHLRAEIKKHRWNDWVREIHEDARKCICDTLLALNSPEADFWVFWSTATYSEKELETLCSLWDEHKDQNVYMALNRLEMALAQQFELEEVQELVQTYIKLSDERQHHEHSAQQWLQTLKEDPYQTRWRSGFLWLHEHNDTQTLFRLDDDGSTTDAFDEPVTINPQAKVRLAHFKDVSEDDRRKWAKTLIEHDTILLHDIFEQPEPNTNNPPPWEDDDLPF